MRVNDHYHRPKRKIIQKVMEASGENPKECITQSEIDKLSELDSVRDAFRAMNLDPHALNLLLCDDDPPDCQANDREGNLVGLEITGIYDQDMERINAQAQTIKEMVYRDWTEDDLVAEITRMIKEKDSKIANARAKRSDWPYAYVNLVIVTDELAIPTEMAESMKDRFVGVEATNIKDAYLLLGYDPNIQRRPCIRIR
jgi:hypothetical protein